MIPEIAAAAIIFEPLRPLVSGLLVREEIAPRASLTVAGLAFTCSHGYLICGYRLIRPGELYMTTSVAVSPSEKVV